MVYSSHKLVGFMWYYILIVQQLTMTQEPIDITHAQLDQKVTSESFDGKKSDLQSDEPAKASTIYEEPGVKPITYPFIEAIVQRTVNEYVRVIRTQRNWLQWLLHLVREERVIRSRYNCSTDTCIYKIQLFTHHLPAHLFQPRLQHRRRTRRSAEQPIFEEQAESKQSTNPVLKDSSKAPIAQNIQGEGNEVEEETELHVIHDDALRLPESPILVGSHNNSGKKEGGKSILETGAGIPQVLSFGEADKINMERVSQEVLSEALLRKNKAQFSKPTPPIQEADNSNIKGDSTESNVDLSTSPPFKVQLIEEPIPEPRGENSAEETSEITNYTTLNVVADDTELTSPAVTVETQTTVTISTSTQNISRNPEIDTSIVEEQQSSEEQTATTLPTTEASGLPSIRHSPRDNEMNVPAIPFGLNQFVGRPYENCTGRFENYCYNALKCVYISVLETAACYCRTGYTGVRCDMFNLPQTLDILKSFREEVIDISALQQPNAVTLYSVVEATARYTVNAVLEEDLLSNWNDPGIP